MKKVFFLLIAAGSALSTFAQAPNQADTVKRKSYTKDALLKRWVLDINLHGGALTQDITAAKTAANYSNGLNVNDGGSLTFKNGMSYGFDAQLGFFWGKKRHFGLGAGFMYQSQEGDVEMGQVFHTEFQSTDRNGDVFRQVIRGDQKITEELRVNNMNIPVVLKYKARFSKVFGFTADAGVLFNVKNKNSYKTDASFDYEAIYKYSVNGDVVTAVYDNSPVPNANSVFYTEADYTKRNPGASAADVTNYFNNYLPSRGYNTGLGIKPTTNSGSVSYTTGSVGFIVRPALNIFLSDNVALNVGAYYIYQPSENDNKANYQLTNRTGEYSSVLNTVTETKAQSYGGNLGLRLFFGKLKDRDGDGVPDKDDNCPDVAGLPFLRGCPDQDGDGIADAEDQCPTVAGLLKFNGCPDSDGDGITDKDDACPYQAGPAGLNGCPDRDGDGIIDKNDACPDKAGTPQYHGCPDADGDGVPDNEDRCPDQAGPSDNGGCPYPPKAKPEEGPAKMTTPILFELNKTVIKRESYPILEDAVRKVNEDKNAIVIVDGYTDITGKPAYNKALSIRRANAVKLELKRMGVNPRKVKIVGHGAGDPTESNDTPEGRMKNRRAVMRLNVAGGR
jgi:outer membrane protein OmpA-like peptidoglycan-associated protein